MTALDYTRAVVGALQVEHGLSQLEAYRALRAPSSAILMQMGLPSLECAEHIARICEARHRLARRAAYTDPIVNA